MVVIVSTIVLTKAYVLGCPFDIVLIGYIFEVLNPWMLVLTVGDINAIRVLFGSLILFTRKLRIPVPPYHAIMNW